MYFEEISLFFNFAGQVIPRHSDFAGAVTIGISPIRLWHVRYGHLNFESLSQLQKQGMVKGLPTFKRENEKCEQINLGTPQYLKYVNLST